MICDLCDKDQQSICERTHHFIKPINECLMRKAQENKQIIEELENIKAEIQGLIDFEESCCGNTTLGYQCLSVIEDKISTLKGEQE